MSPQVARFGTGGFVLHKLTLDGTQGKFSAWYDADGTLTDAEQFDRLGRTRPVRRDGPTWEALKRYGRIYRHAPPDHGQPVRPYDENPARMKASIASYEDALKFWGESRTPHTLGHNTRVDYQDGALRIIYHATAIVTYYSDGRIELNSGGYRTSTTKSHMNSVLPPGVGVYQKKGEWYVSVGSIGGETHPDVEFFDKMILSPASHVGPANMLRYGHAKYNTNPALGREEYGVFAYREDGRYSRAAAIETYARERDAEKCAQRLTDAHDPRCGERGCVSRELRYVGNPEGDEGKAEFYRYATQGERRAARRLVRAALARGYAVSVHDGEEYTVKQSRKESDILNALATTGQDVLQFRETVHPGQVAPAVGQVVLIWGNDPSGDELMADYTDNAATNDLVRAAGGPAD